jgi:hypothetical protein
MRFLPEPRLQRKTMTITTFDVPAVRIAVMPRGARVAADLFVRALDWLGRPAARRTLSRAEEAATVRDMAYRLQHTDPGFAADLFAAAARHESQGE